MSKAETLSTPSLAAHSLSHCPSVSVFLGSYSFRSQPPQPLLLKILLKKGFFSLSYGWAAGKPKKRKTAKFDSGCAFAAIAY
jgi:hypothetical protein